MCGIAGIIRSNRTPNPDQTQADTACVNRMLTAQTHRGPDAEGIYQTQNVTLGHRRLAIIDLSEAGRQPMHNEDKTLWVTFNGEIYNHQDLRQELQPNHQFRSQTDTEVLLHGYEQWGIEGLLKRLRGMFAFALYDQRNERLILVRDRLGIKPLYYHEGADFLAFASEVKALLASGQVPNEQDRSALAGFLIAGAVPAPRTIVKGIRCLEAGHWAEWREGNLDIHKYWDLDRQPEYKTFDPQQLQTTLEDAVRRHLISDVPLGVFLSGGVDSAGLVALASRIRKQRGESLTTLTVVFDEKEFSEASSASDIAKRFQTHHREVRVTSADFQRELPAFLAAMDQPTNDGVNSYFVSKAAREAGLTVVLSGLGGDEVFWGYKHYRWLRWGRMANQLPAGIRQLVGNVGSLSTRDNWKRTAWLKSGNIYLIMRGFFAPDKVAKLMDMTQAELTAVVEEHFGQLGADINYIEMKRYMHDQLLRDTDIFSMAHSIEARVPYLDHELVERLLYTAPSLKLDRAMNKPLLVQAVNDASVEQAGARPKRGFTFPMARWMKTATPEMQEMAETGSLVKSAVHDCWTDFSEGRMHWSRAWALTVLGATN